MTPDGPASGTSLETLLVPSHLGDEGADLVLDLHEAAQSTLHDGGEVEQSQCVASGGSVEHHH